MQQWLTIDKLTEQNTDYSIQEKECQFLGLINASSKFESNVNNIPFGYLTFSDPAYYYLS